MIKSTIDYEINIDMTAIDNIKKMIDSEAHVKIGILSNPKAPGSTSNSYGIAQIGAVQEFGGNPRVTARMRKWFYHNFGVRLRKEKSNIRIPARSFLRLTMHLKASAFSEFIQANRDKIFKSITEGSWINTLGKFGAVWVSYVHEAFESRGWGTWPALSDLTIGKRPNPKKESFLLMQSSSVPLQNKGFLRQAITHEVVSK